MYISVHCTVTKYKIRKEISSWNQVQKGKEKENKIIVIHVEGLYTIKIGNIAYQGNSFPV